MHGLVHNGLCGAAERNAAVRLAHEQKARAFAAVRLHLVRARHAKLGFVRLVGYDPAYLRLRQPVVFGLPAHVFHRYALGDDDPFLFLQVRLLLVGQIQRRFVDQPHFQPRGHVRDNALAGRALVEAVQIMVAGNARVFHNDPFLAVQLALFPLRRRKRRQRFADLSLFRVVVHRRKQDRGVVHRHHHDFVAADGLDKVQHGKLFVAGLQPVPLVALVKAVALFRLRIHVRPVVMVLARLIPAPDIRTFLFLHHSITFCPFSVPSYASMFARIASYLSARQPCAPRGRSRVPGRGLLCKAAAGCPGRLRPRGFAVPRAAVPGPPRSRSAAFRCAKPTLENAFLFAASPRFAEAVAAALRRFAARSRRPVARGGSSIRTAPPCRIPQAPEQTLKDQITRYFPPCPSGPAVGFFMLKSSRRMSWTAASGACAAVLQ